MVSRETKASLEKRNRKIYDLSITKGYSLRRLAKVSGLSHSSIGLILKRVPRESKERNRLALVEQVIRSGKSVEITALDLPVRISLALVAAAIVYTDDLFSKGKRDFLSMRNLGRKSVEFLEDLFLSYDKWTRKKWL